MEYFSAYVVLLAAAAVTMISVWRLIWNASDYLKQKTKYLEVKQKYVQQKMTKGG